MASTADFRNGLVLEIEGQLFQLVYFQHVKPGRAAPLSEPSSRTSERARSSTGPTPLESGSTTFGWSAGRCSSRMSTGTSITSWISKRSTTSC